MGHPEVEASPPEVVIMDITRKEHLENAAGAISWSSESTLVGVPHPPPPFRGQGSQSRGRPVAAGIRGSWAPRCFLPRALDGPS